MSDWNAIILALIAVLGPAISGIVALRVASNRNRTEMVMSDRQALIHFYETELAHCRGELRECRVETEKWRALALRVIPATEAAVSYAEELNRKELKP